MITSAHCSGTVAVEAPRCSVLQVLFCCGCLLFGTFFCVVWLAVCMFQVQVLGLATAAAPRIQAELLVLAWRF
jgi:hypothetical protein